MIRADSNGDRFLCGSCDRWMHAEDFYRNMKGHCKTCRAYSNAKGSARARGIEFALTLSFFLEHFNMSSSRACYYCGIQESAFYDRSMKATSGGQLEVLGLDRLDSSRGYIADNVVVCCFTCNRTKGAHMSVSAMKTIGDGIRAILEDADFIPAVYPPRHLYGD